MQLWLRADNGVVTSGSSVSTWSDNSGLSNNATQSTGTAQPTLISSAINSQSALSFNGTSDYLQMPSGFSNFSAGATEFVVVKPTALQVQNFVNLGTGGSTNYLQFENSSTSAVLEFVTNNGTTTSTTSSASAALTAGTAALVDVNFNGTNSAQIFVNGVASGSAGTMTAMTNVNRTSNFIGQSQTGTGFCDGEIAEVIVYNTALTTAQQQAVEAYLEARYGLKVNPPTLSVGSGVYSATQTVTIAADPGAVIHYTTNGTTPTSGSPVYSTPVIVTGTTMLQAIAVQSFGTSSVSSSFIQVDPLTVNLPRGSMFAWWKADFMPPSGSSVSTWTDASGTGNSFSQTITADQPGWSSNVINSLPALTFNGSQFLQASSLSSNNFSSGLSAFIVAKPSTITNQARFFDFGAGESTNNISVTELTSPSGALNMLSYNGTSSSNVSSSSTVFTTSNFVLAEAFQSGSGGGDLYANGALVGNGVLNNINNVSRIYNYIGGDHNGTHLFQGDIAEIIIYSASLSQSAQQLIEGYLFSRYHIAAHQPTITPGGPYTVSNGPQTVTITSPDPGVSIYYTTNGTTPTSGSTPYTGPFVISATGTTPVNAIAILGSVQSTVATSTIQIDPNTANIPRSGLFAWFKGDLGLSAGTVSSWPDVSGSGNTITQTVSGNRPTCSTGVLNGLPVVGFNGTSDYLQFPSIAQSFTGGTSIFIVTEAASLTAGKTFFSFGTSTSSNTKAITGYLNGSGVIAYQVFSTTSPSVQTPSSTITTGTYGLLEMVQDTTNTGYIYVNGTQKATNTLVAIPNVAWPYGYLGIAQAGNGQYSGNIAEALIYNRPVTATERASIESYLMGRYGLLVNVPVITPTNYVASSSQQVTITGDPGAVIRYTTDGTTPISTSPLYTGPFYVTTTTTVNAKEFGVYGNSATATSVIQIDSATTNVPHSGLEVWLKADNGPQISSGAHVTSWNDMSGNQFNATQTILLNEPTLLTAALNGLPVVQFNGTTSVLQFPATLPSCYAGASIFAVFEPSALSANDALFSLGTSTAHNYNAMSLTQYNSSGAFSFNTYNSIATASSLASNNGVMSTSQYSLLEARQDSVSNPCWIYNSGLFLAQSDTNQPIANVTWTNGYVGANQAMGGLLHGSIAELMLYNRPVTLLERYWIEAYLLGRYNIGTPTPAAPTFSVAAGALNGPTQVAINAQQGATIYVTTDGSTPTTGSPVYSQPLTISYSQTVQAIAVVNGVSSGIGQAIYTLNTSNWPAPSATDPTTLNINLQLPAIAVPQ